MRGEKKKKLRAYRPEPPDRLGAEDSNLHCRGQNPVSCRLDEPPIKSAEGRNRTADTAVFSRVLYQLSYLGLAFPIIAKVEEIGYPFLPCRIPKFLRVADATSSAK